LLAAKIFFFLGRLCRIILTVGLDVVVGGDSTKRMPSVVGVKVGQYVGKTVGSCVGGHLLCLPLLREVGLGVTGESPISIDVLGDDEG
jgi:hypothetical protein